MEKSSVLCRLGGILVTASILVFSAVSFPAQNFKNPEDRETTAKLAAPVCNARMIRGAYGYSFAGIFYVAPSVPVSLASVGTMTFDGEGGVSGQDTNSFGGEITSYPTTGSYSVSGDCTGSLNVNLPSGFVIESRIVIVNEGKDILLIQTNPGTVIHGALKQ